MQLVVRSCSLSVGGLVRIITSNICAVQRSGFSHSARVLYPDHWLSYNNLVYPPQKPDEEKRPAFICHEKQNIKYSPKKMWYIASFIRGMSVDEAIKQLEMVPKKGAIAVRETILEAQKIAVEKHNVEYKTNLWVAESFCTKGLVVKGIRRHAKMRVGKVEYKYCHYYVKLEEGTPPEHFYYQECRTGSDYLEKWMSQMRNRRIPNSL